VPKADIHQFADFFEALERCGNRNADIGHADGYVRYAVETTRCAPSRHNNAEG